MGEGGRGMETVNVVWQDAGKLVEEGRGGMQAGGDAARPKKPRTANSALERRRTAGLGPR